MKQRRNAQRLTMRGWAPNTHAAEGQSRHDPDRFEFAPVRVREFTMHGPYGTVYPNWIRRLEIVRPEWIVFQHGTHAEDPRMFVHP